MNDELCFDSDTDEREASDAKRDLMSNSDELSTVETTFRFLRFLRSVCKDDSPIDEESLLELEDGAS